MVRILCLAVVLLNVIFIQPSESLGDNNIRRRQRYNNSHNVRSNILRSPYSTPRSTPNWFWLRAAPPCETIPDRPPVKDDTKNKDLWQILEHTNNTFKLDDAHKNVIILLGNTGSGKTTITQLLAGDPNALTVYKTSAGQKIILDKSNKIGMTTASQTLIPELVVDTVSGLAFYDCPGFLDNRGADIDITINFLLKQVFDHVTSVKLVFVVIYSAVLGNNDKSNFDNLASAAAKMVKNFDKLENGIGLVITKAPIYQETDPPSEFTQDDYMTTIRGFLNMYIDDQRNLKDGKNAEADKFIDRKIGFAYALLKGNKIGVMPNPLQCGPLSQYPRALATRATLKNLMQNGIQFVQTTSDDFGFPLAAGSLDKMEKYRADVNTNVARLFNNLIAATKQQQLGKIIAAADPSTFIKEEKIAFDAIYDYLKSPAATLELMGKAVEGTLIKRLYNTDQASRFAKEMAEQGKYLKFFDDMTTPGTSSIGRYRTGWIQPIQSWINEEMGRRVALYEILAKLRKELTSYPFHHDKPSRSTIGDIPSSPDVGFLEKIGIKSLSDSDKGILHIGQSLMTDKDVASFRVMMTEALEDTVVDCVVSNMTVTGVFIKVTDFMTPEGTFNCPVWAPNLIQVFGRRTIFFDMEVISSNHKIMAELYFISPRFEVVTGTSTAQINLDGEPGREFPPNEWKADDGTAIWRDGINGKPGVAGISAGRFVGITDEIVGKLKISAKGGQGAGGQAGGIGAEGAAGRDYPFSDFPSCPGGRGLRNYCDKLTNSIAFQYWCYKFGGLGGNGGQGGHGGIGGGGGFGGEIQILNAADGSPMSVEADVANGTAGKPGTGGEGGVGGLQGIATSAYIYADDMLICSWSSQKSTTSTVRARHGDTGITGGNTYGQPWEPVRQDFNTNAKSVADEFVAYAKEKAMGPEENEFVNQVERLNL